MRRLVWIAACLAALSGSVLGQAIAEGALTHGAAATASSGAGKAMGGIVNQLAGKLGQQTSNTIHPAVTTVRSGTQRSVKVPQAATTTSVPPAGGSLIASVQGGEPQAPQANCAPEPETKSSPDAPKQSDCVVKTRPAVGDQAAHPSEITLPAAK
jgi:hypothetical protein